VIVLVCGGRDYFGDIDEAMNLLHSQFPIELVIHGDAKGADRRGGMWAKNKGIHYAAVPALWDILGRKEAGPKRNSAMLLLKPQYCVAFPGGSGTADMIQKCEAVGIPVWRPYS